MAKTIKLVTDADLSEDDFMVEGGKLKLKPGKLAAVAREQGAVVTEYVLEQLRPNTEVQIIQDANTRTRKLVAINAMGLGIIALDFIYRGTSKQRTVAFRMPEGAPTPRATITTNAGSGLLWWNANSRDIIFSGVDNGQRIVLNLVGYF